MWCRPPSFLHTSVMNPLWLFSCNYTKSSWPRVLLHVQEEGILHGTHLRSERELSRHVFFSFRSYHRTRACSSLYLSLSPLYAFNCKSLESSVPLKRTWVFGNPICQLCICISFPRSLFSLSVCCVCASYLLVCVYYCVCASVWFVCVCDHSLIHASLLPIGMCSLVGEDDWKIVNFNIPVMFSSPCLPFFSLTLSLFLHVLYVYVCIYECAVCVY